MLFVEGPLLDRDTFPVEGDCSVEGVPGFPEEEDEEVEVDFPPLEVPLEELEGDFPLDLPRKQNNLTERTVNAASSFWSTCINLVQ